MDGLKIDRKSSIEDEPRTLDFHQIDFAREAALTVVNTRNIQEAFTIFTEGLEPVERCAEGGGGACDRMMKDDDQNQGDRKSCWFNNGGLRDIVSAPF